jgi:predicted secreted protein
MSILAWIAVILALWLVVGLLVAIPICRFIHAGEGVPLGSSREAATRTHFRKLRVVDQEHPIAAARRQIASGV